jgi:hypothetical protein
VQSLRLYDPTRRPPNWTDVIRANQFAAFAKQLGTGIACDLEGRVFDDTGHAACAVFDSFGEARRECEAAVARTPDVQIDIFDAQGRANPPLLTVVHPDRAMTQDAGPQAARRRSLMAWGLVVASAPLIVVAFALEDTLMGILPGFIAANMLLYGGRLLWFNLGMRETERLREERVARVSMDGRDG